jgi:hypothetical protein
MQLLIQITNLPPGSNVGPNFNIIPNVGVASPATATLTELLAGIIVTVDDIVADVSVESTGVCENSAQAPVQCVDPLKLLITNYFNSTEDPTPAGFIEYINPLTLLPENSCEWCYVGCNRYVLASIETYLNYAEAVGITAPPAEVP